MCGIFCELLQYESEEEISKHSIKNQTFLANRGPDNSNVITFGNILVFGGFVLWQQGEDICKQPLENEHFILLFNGDIFNADDRKLKSESDTTWLAQRISKCKSDTSLLKLFQTLEGPFSLVLFIKNTKELYFCRDSLGRNSLIIERGEGFRLRISSTSYISNMKSKNVSELPPLGIYKINITQPHTYSIFPWMKPNVNWLQQVKEVEGILGIPILNEAISPYWLNLKKTAETFDFYRIFTSVNISSFEVFETLLKNKDFTKELDNFATLLENSVKYRVQTTPKYCKNCIIQKTDCDHSKIAILFSGGIDCSILAVLAHKYCDEKDSIDLINIAFEKIKSDNEEDWNVPDRHSAKSTLKELQAICPSRKWNFIEVNISRQELCSNLSTHIKHLIYPLDTVLDESIGCAFWFAARGSGFCKNELYQSTARVIIVGSGADELFGGYIRHRNAYLRCAGTELQKEENVLAELEKDWERLPSRNLARDDRIIADNGKTSRAPFIEENLVRYIRCLKACQRSCYILEEGIGDKLFLRAYGYRLKLKTSACLKKRAIQFGSRIANKKQNAKNKSEYLNFT